MKRSRDAHSVEKEARRPGSRRRKSSFPCCLYTINPDQRRIAAAPGRGRLTVIGGHVDVLDEVVGQGVRDLVASVETSAINTEGKKRRSCKIPLTLPLSSCNAAKQTQATKATLRSSRVKRGHNIRGQNDDYGRSEDARAYPTCAGSCFPLPWSRSLWGPIDASIRTSREVRRICTAKRGSKSAQSIEQNDL